MSRCLILLLSILTVCAAPTPFPARLFPVDFEGRRYVCITLDIRLVKIGDLVAYHAGGKFMGGRLMSERGPGVFRAEGDGLVIVSESNYVGKLVLAAK